MANLLHGSKTTGNLVASGFVTASTIVGIGSSFSNMAVITAPLATDSTWKNWTWWYLPAALQVPGTKFKVTLVGGGGGGGGTINATAGYQGSGGAGGSAISAVLSYVPGNNKLAYSIGIGGPGGIGTGNTAPKAGQDTMIMYAGYIMLASGGVAGTNGGASAAGGNNNGIFGYLLDQYVVGDQTHHQYGAVGTSGGSGGLSTSTSSYMNIGGNSGMGFGTGGTLQDGATGGNGLSGIGYGAGGSGGRNGNNASLRDGGAGTQGIIIIEY